MRIVILGCRGIPANHGGFETFTERFALYLSERGWEVTVYCQEVGKGAIYEDEWRGIKLIHIPVHSEGALGTIIFEWKCTLHAAARQGPILVLGYNTALFSLVYRLKKITNIINMDGIEWKRGKWGACAKAWFYINEKVATLLGDHLIADHPEIKNHLAQYAPREKISVIPYHADILESAEQEELTAFNLLPDKYILLVARPEPENSILEIVSAYCRKPREIPLVILGEYTPANNEYHRLVMHAAKNNVLFLGAIYEKRLVDTLRFFARLYVHGHTVGGTNPSLIEALGAGNAVLAHDNKFNRWVAGSGARYFKNEDECARHLDQLLAGERAIAAMKKYSREHMRKHYTADKVYGVYEKLFQQYQ